MDNMQTSNTFDSLTRLSQSCHVLQKRSQEISAFQSLCNQAVTQTHPLEFADLSIGIDIWDIAKGLWKLGADSIWHAHGECQIQFVFRGKVMFQNERNKVVLSGGEGVIIAPMCNHKWEALEDSAMLGVLLKIGGSAIDNLFADLFSEDSLHMPVVSTTMGSTWMADILELLLDDSKNLKVPMIALLMNLWLMDFMQSVYGFNDAAPAKRIDSELTSELLCRHAESFMRANLEKHLSVNDIATHLGISERHLHRIFVKTTGQSIHDSLINMRLEKAYQMIIGGSPLLIKQIASQCGFKSAAYFSSAFKKHFHCSPNQMFNDMKRSYSASQRKD